MACRVFLDERTVASVLMCLLSAVILLGASAGPPVVAISSVPDIEDGTLVRVVGVLVDVRIYSSGAEGVTLADLEDHGVVRIISSLGVKPQPSTYVHVGDEMLVEGEVSRTESGPIIFARSDDLTLIQESNLVLTVWAVSSNWILFEEDTIRIKGVLKTVESGRGLRLCDCSGPSSMAVMTVDIDLRPLAGSTVTLTATLRFDHILSMVVLCPLHYVVAQ